MLSRDRSIIVTNHSNKRILYLLCIKFRNIIKSSFML